DARPMLSTARSSTHRTGEFAVLGSARGAYIGGSGPPWSRGRWGTDAPELARVQSRRQLRARWRQCDSATCHALARLL
ncbi:hypothetical protein EV714DRAFT_221855, partial [Schizophyllum commune]